MGIQSRQILRAHAYMWVLNIVRAQHNSWLPMQLVVDQDLPETWEFIRMFGHPKLVGGSGRIWTCLDV